MRVAVLTRVRAHGESMCATLICDEITQIATLDPSQISSDAWVFDVALLDCSTLTTSDVLLASIQSWRIVCYGVRSAQPGYENALRHMGVCSALPSDATTVAIQGALRSAPAGQSVISQRHSTRRTEPLGPKSRSHLLTHRQREVAFHVARGLSNKQIALAMGIRAATVRNHIHDLLGKMHFARRSDVRRILSLLISAFPVIVGI